MAPRGGRYVRRRGGRRPRPHGADPLSARLPRTLVRDVAGRENAVRLCGWVHTAPDATGAFTLRDHTGLIAVVGADASCQRESAVEVIGTLDGHGGRLVADTVTVVGPAETPLPIDTGAPLPTRLDWRHLDLRQPRNRLIFEVQTTVERAMRDWWHGHGFLELHSPKLRATPNMSGRELFTLDYFDRPAYLAQSPQFSKQMAMCAGFERVFEIGPVFRANPLLTRRHDTEFVSVDVEVSWIDSHEDVMALEEQWLRDVVAAVDREHGPAIADAFGRRIAIPDTPFPRVTMAEAQRVLAGQGHRSAAAPGDIDPEGERMLAEHVARETGHELVFLTEYREAVRPFYHMRLDDGSDLTRSFDLLWNGLEITTGAQREHRHNRLVAQAGRNPSRLDTVGPYLDFFRHGCPPHGGFGLGLSRLLVALLGLDDVREATFLPRDRERLSP